MSEAISGTSVRGYGEPHRRPAILPEPDEVGKPALPATVTGGCDLGYAWRTVGEAYRDAGQRHPGGGTPEVDRTD